MDYIIEQLDHYLGSVKHSKGGIGELLLQKENLSCLLSALRNATLSCKESYDIKGGEYDCIIGMLEGICDIQLSWFSSVSDTDVGHIIPHIRMTVNCLANCCLWFPVDRKRERVEISPEQLYSLLASFLAKILAKNSRVLFFLTLTPKSDKNQVVSFIQQHQYRFWSCLFRASMILFQRVIPDIHTKELFHDLAMALLLVLHTKNKTKFLLGSELDYGDSENISDKSWIHNAFYLLQTLASGSWTFTFLQYWKYFLPISNPDGGWNLFYMEELYPEYVWDTISIILRKNPGALRMIGTKGGGRMSFTTISERVSGFVLAIHDRICWNLQNNDAGDSRKLNVLQIQWNMLSWLMKHLNFDHNDFIIEILGKTLKLFYGLITTSCNNNNLFTNDLDLVLSHILPGLYKIVSKPLSDMNIDGLILNLQKIFVVFTDVSYSCDYEALQSIWTKVHIINLSKMLHILVSPSLDRLNIRSTMFPWSWSGVSTMPRDIVSLWIKDTRSDPSTQYEAINSMLHLLTETAFAPCKQKETNGCKVVLHVKEILNWLVVQYDNMNCDSRSILYCIDQTVRLLTNFTTFSENLSVADVRDILECYLKILSYGASIDAIVQDGECDDVRVSPSSFSILTQDIFDWMQLVLHKDPLFFINLDAGSITILMSYCTIYPDDMHRFTAINGGLGFLANLIEYFNSSKSITSESDMLGSMLQTLFFTCKEERFKQKHTQYILVHGLRVLSFLIPHCIINNEFGYRSKQFHAFSWVIITLLHHGQVGYKVKWNAASTMYRILDQTKDIILSDTSLLINVQTLDMMFIELLHLIYYCPNYKVKIHSLDIFILLLTMLNNNEDSWTKSWIKKTKDQFVTEYHNVLNKGDNPILLKDTESELYTEYTKRLNLIYSIIDIPTV
jgi:hypothetical protein